MLFRSYWDAVAHARWFFHSGDWVDDHQSSDLNFYAKHGGIRVPMGGRWMNG